jgi:hypothetical protein
MSLDLSGLSAYAEDHQVEIFSTMVNSLDVVNDIAVRENVKNSVPLTKLDVDADVKPFNNNEEYGSSAAYSDRDLSVESAKVEMKVNVEEYKNTYLENVRRAGSGANSMDIPFEQFFVEQIAKRTAAAINNKAIYNGLGPKSAFPTYAPGSTYSSGDQVSFTNASGSLDYYVANQAVATSESPTTHPAKWDKKNAEAIMKGFGKLFTEALAGSYSAVTTGDIDNSAVFAYAAQRALWEASDEAFKSEELTLFQSWTDFNFLLKDLRETEKYVLSDKDYLPNGGIYLPYTDKKVICKPATWMLGSRRLVLTKPENLIFGTDLTSDWNEFKILTQSDLWNVKIGLKFRTGVQIRDLDAVWIGDQA